MLEVHLVPSDLFLCLRYTGNKISGLENRLVGDVIV